jgi:hypothetical protein
MATEENKNDKRTKMTRTRTRTITRTRTRENNKGWRKSRTRKREPKQLWIHAGRVYHVTYHTAETSPCCKSRKENTEAQPPSLVVRSSRVNDPIAFQQPSSAQIVDLNTAISQHPPLTNITTRNPRIERQIQQQV